MARHWIWFLVGALAALGFVALVVAPGSLDPAGRMGFSVSFVMPAVLVALAGAGVGRLLKRTAAGLGVGSFLGASLLVLLLMGLSYGTAQASNMTDYNRDELRRFIEARLQTQQREAQEAADAKPDAVADPDGFNDCILRHMPGVTSDRAAVEIRGACSRRHNVNYSSGR